MAAPHYNLWTGGLPSSEADAQKAKAIPAFPPPAPLQHLAVIEYHWGPTHFQIVAIAGSLHEAPWGDEPVTWLYCKAMTVGQIKLDESTQFMTVLIPAHYITSIRPGTPYKHTRSRPIVEVGVFPPNQPAPEHPVQVEQLERILAELLSVERN